MHGIRPFPNHLFPFTSTSSLLFERKQNVLTDALEFDPPAVGILR